MMSKVIKYVVSKTKGKTKLYLCSQLDRGCVNFYSLPHDSYYKWDKDLLNAIKFPSVILAKKYTDKFSNTFSIKVEPIVCEEIKVTV